VEILVRSNRHDPAQDDLLRRVGSEVVTGLGPWARRVISAHLELVAERDGGTAPAAVRCRLEVVPSGHAPLAVMHRAASDAAAVQGAVYDMRGVLARMLGRIDARPTTTRHLA
jgi:hypothetical protein